MVLTASALALVFPLARASSSRKRSTCLVTLPEDLSEAAQPLPELELALELASLALGTFGFGGALTMMQFEIVARPGQPSGQENPLGFSVRYWSVIGGVWSFGDIHVNV